MRNILLVARNEFLHFARKPSFLIATLAVPLVAAVIGLVMNYSPVGDDTSPESVLGVVGQPDLTGSGIIGVVDGSGVVTMIPSPLQGVVLRYQTAQEAEAALRAGTVDAYYLIAPDYLESGDVERVARRFEPLAEDSALVEFLLTSNLLQDADPTRLALIREPLPEPLIVHENIGERAADRAVGAEAEGLAFGSAYILAMLIYTTTFMSASYLLQSVTTEKENRLMEILLTSIRPFEMLAGKVLGLGGLGFLQTIAWAFSAYWVAQLGFVSVSLGDLGIGWGLAAMVLLYYVLGYGVYSTMMAGIGALVSSAKESGPATMLVVMPAILPLLFLTSFVEQPHSLLAVLFSLIPFTAPITMMVRLTQGGVPAWQIVASIALMILFIVGLLRLVARLFRTQTLLSFGILSPRRAWAVLREG